MISLLVADALLHAGQAGRRSGAQGDRRHGRRERWVFLSDQLAFKLGNRNYALAGDAIHVTESTARAYYAHDSVEKRRPELEKIMQAIATDAT